MRLKKLDAVVKGQTASSSLKNAITTNNIKILVPQHIKEGEKIVINTENLEYLENQEIKMESQATGKYSEKNLRDLRKYIIRDYSEIEELQSSSEDTKAFINRSQKS